MSGAALAHSHGPFYPHLAASTNASREGERPVPAGTVAQSAGSGTPIAADIQGPENFAGSPIQQGGPS